MGADRTSAANAVVCLELPFIFLFLIFLSRFPTS
jgi:hypothetical protein